MLDLATLLIRHEGLRLLPYLDTVGKTTIGVGRNLSDNGITEAEALFMLQTDIDRAKAACAHAFPWADGMTGARQNVLHNMMFNLGPYRLLKFKRMLAALQCGRYEEAAREMLSSRWSTQVGARARELAEMMRQG